MNRIFHKIYQVAIFLLFSFVCQAQSVAIDSLLRVLPTLKGENLSRAYLEISKEYAYIDPAKVIEYANLAMPIIQENQDREQEAFANLLLGAGYLYSGNFEDARIFTEKGLSVAKEIRHEEYTCMGLNSLAAYHMNIGEYDLSMQLFLETVERAKAAGLEERAATAQLNLGSILTNMGERTRGLSYLMESLKFFETQNNPKVVARILNNVAVNYHTWKDYDRALEFYQKTLTTYQSIKDFVGQVVVNNNIGEIYKDKKDYQKALPYYLRTIEIADSVGVGDYYKAYGWIGLAEAYQLMGRYSQSRENANLALDVFDRLKMQEGVSTAKLILARLNLSEGYLDQALMDVNQSLDLSEKIGIADLQKGAFAVKSDILEKQGHYKEAFAILKLYAQMADTLHTQERSNDLAQMRAELEMSEKQNEIELLQKDNQIKDLQINRQQIQSRYLFLTVGLLILVFIVMLSYMKAKKDANDLVQRKSNQIKVQHEELVRVNETKDKFLSIIGHDLRNPIGAFKDVLAQLADFPEMFTDELRQQITKELRDEAESTYFLLDNLLSWAKSQQKNIVYRPERLDIKTLVENNFLLNSRFSGSKNIRLISKLKGNPEVYADQNMVSLILRNLISNAIKFTREGGEVTVSAEEKGDWVAVSVTDTGIGIPKEQQSDLFSGSKLITTYGTNHEKGSGLGLRLCQEFVDIHGGKITLLSEPGQGSAFTFTLKKYKDSIFY